LNCKHQEMCIFSKKPECSFDEENLPSTGLEPVGSSEP
jgi:hypothetical protein